MVRSVVLSICFLFFINYSNAQVQRPKLVVGIVVDQMRWDFLYRYNHQYSRFGFNRLLNQGFSAENCMIPYTPTYTAPGHACVYTGSVPAYHGIVGNNWFNVETGRNTYCTDDQNAKTVGSTSNAGKMSPANMWTTTITDELRISTNNRSRVFGVALKDRGAILPAGHSANAAYWYDAGKWISSSYYKMTELPKWVQDYNARDEVAKWMKKDWEKQPNINYDMSTDDAKPYEDSIRGLSGSSFPHKLSKLTDKDKYEAFRATPWANTYTLDFAKQIIDNENLGRNINSPDFLAVSISSTDYIGHAFGPNSQEIQDTYIRLDKDIESFLSFLDMRVGMGNYTVFLTADHGVAHIPGYLKEMSIPGGVFNDDNLAASINKYCDSVFGIKKAVQSLMNYQVYLNKAEIKQAGKDEEKVAEAIIGQLRAQPYIVTAFLLEEIMETTIPEPQKQMLTNGYNPKRSGDIQFTLKPGYFDGGAKGTTHGLWNPYDAHIPCVFFGWGIKAGKTNRETYMTDIAPTIAALLKIQMPNGNVGKVMMEALK